MRIKGRRWKEEKWLSRNENSILKNKWSKEIIEKKKQFVNNKMG